MRGALALAWLVRTRPFSQCLLFPVSERRARLPAQTLGPVLGLRSELQGLRHSVSPRS
jgi:hypothetical protein